MQYAIEKRISVDVLFGPSKKRLSKAHRAIQTADAFRAEIGSNIPNDDYDYLSIILVPTCLTWYLKGKHFPYRINAFAERIVELDDGSYLIEFKHQNWRRLRTLRAQDAEYRLDPETTYFFRIIYNPTTRSGFVTQIKKESR